MADEPKLPTLQIHGVPFDLFDLIVGTAAKAGIDRDAMVIDWLKIRAKEDDGLTQAQLKQKYKNLPKAKR